MSSGGGEEAGGGRGGKRREMECRGGNLRGEREAHVGGRVGIRDGGDYTGTEQSMNHFLVPIISNSMIYDIMASLSRSRDLTWAHNFLGLSCSKVSLSIEADGTEICLVINNKMPSIM